MYSQRFSFFYSYDKSTTIAITVIPRSLVGSFMMLKMTYLMFLSVTYEKIGGTQWVFGVGWCFLLGGGCHFMYTQ